MNEPMFEWSVKNKLAQYKKEKQLIRIDLNLWIETMTVDDWKEYPRFMRWREKNEQWYPTVFPISKDGTINWYKEQVYGKEDRILFWVCCNMGKIGHVGLSNFDWKNRSCDLDNILRGNDMEPGSMTKAIEWLVKMARNYLLVQNIYLKTFGDNIKALRFYRGCGFHSVRKTPTDKIVTGNRTEYIENINGKSRHFVYMEHRQ